MARFKLENTVHREIGLAHVERTEDAEMREMGLIRLGGVWIWDRGRRRAKSISRRSPHPHPELPSQRASPP